MNKHGMELRELIWAHIKSHPGATCADVEESLGLTSLHHYLGDLYLNRVVDRDAVFKLCANTSGKTRVFAYTTRLDVFKWPKNPLPSNTSLSGRKRPVKTAPPAPTPRLPTFTAPPRVERVERVEEDVKGIPEKLTRAFMLANIRELPFNDVVAIRNELNKWMAA